MAEEKRASGYREPADAGVRELVVSRPTRAKCLVSITAIAGFALCIGMLLARNVEPSARLSQIGFCLVCVGLCLSPVRNLATHVLIADRRNGSLVLEHRIGPLRFRDRRTRTPHMSDVRVERGDGSISTILAIGREVIVLDTHREDVHALLRWGRREPDEV